MVKISKRFVSVALIVFSIFIGCDSAAKKGSASKDQSTSKDTVIHAPINVKSSDSIPQKSSIENSKFEISNLLGAWTVDPEGPHADFELNNEYWMVVDNEGNENVVYKIYSDSIKVFFKDFTTKGQILKAQNDSLSIAWDNQDPTIYLRWKN